MQMGKKTEGKYLYSPDDIVDLESHGYRIVGEGVYQLGASSDWISRARSKLTFGILNGLHCESSHYLLEYVVLTRQETHRSFKPDVLKINSST